MIKGLFEIHITVDHIRDGLFKLYDFVSKHKGMKIILAVADEGKYKDQYMISKWCNGTSHEVILKAGQIQKEMIDFDLTVLRLKVESMAHNEGVPTTREMFDDVTDGQADDGDYFEYHVKMEGEIPSRELLKQIKNELNIDDKDTFLQYKIGISYNLCGSKLPMFTIRVYNHRLVAEEIKNTVLDYMKAQYDCCFSGSIQQEFSIRDTYPELDDEWLV